MPVEILGPLYQRALSEHPTKEQTEALIDMLIFAVMADGQMVEPEREELDDVFDQVGWDDEMESLAFVSASKDRVEEAKRSGDAAKAYVRDIGERLGSEELQKKAYELAARIICADHALDVAERGLMGIVIEVFDLDRRWALDVAVATRDAFDIT